MPYMYFDEEAFDEDFDEEGDEERDEESDGESDEEVAEEKKNFTYEPPESTQFAVSALETLPALVLGGLKRAGVSKVRIRYDGGYDEGFAHFEFALIAGRKSDRMATVKLLDGLSAQIKSASADSGISYMVSQEPARANEYALDEFAHALASQLLGDGYGTGEYELYGAFTADLETGELADDPDATKPKGRT